MRGTEPRRERVETVGSGDSAQHPEGATCNTPPQNTLEDTLKEQIPEQNQIIMDWFEFTLCDDFMVRDRWHCLSHYIKIPGVSFRRVPRGMHGYKTQFSYGKTVILLDGSEGMGVHVILSGQALREMSNDPLELLHWVLHNGGKVSRIDLAFDNVDGELTLLRVKRAVNAGAVSCRAKEYRQMKRGRISTGEVTGETFYFGSAQSDTQYRIYDKAAEQGLDGHWIRCEGQYRHENAQRVAQLIHEARLDVGPVFCGLLRGYLNILTPSKTDTNKSRWKVAKWWLDLLQGAEKIKLSLVKQPPSLHRRREWFIKQVAPTFAMLLDGFGSDSMLDAYKIGKARMTPEQREIIQVPF